jgi:hypothetical protein
MNRFEHRLAASVGRCLSEPNLTAHPYKARRRTQGTAVKFHTVDGVRHDRRRSHRMCRETGFPAGRDFIDGLPHYELGKYTPTWIGRTLSISWAAGAMTARGRIVPVTIVPIPPSGGVGAVVARFRADSANETSREARRTLSESELSHADCISFGVFSRPHPRSSRMRSDQREGRPARAGGVRKSGKLLHAWAGISGRHRNRPPIGGRRACQGDLLAERQGRRAGASRGSRLVRKRETIDAGRVSCQTSACSGSASVGGALSGRTPRQGLGKSGGRMVLSHTVDNP